MWFLRLNFLPWLADKKEHFNQPSGFHWFFPHSRITNGFYPSLTWTLCSLTFPVNLDGSADKDRHGKWRPLSLKTVKRRSFHDSLVSRNCHVEQGGQEHALSSTVERLQNPVPGHKFTKNQCTTNIGNVPKKSWQTIAAHTPYPHWIQGQSFKCFNSTVENRTLFKSLLFQQPQPSDHQHVLHDLRALHLGASNWTWTWPTAAWDAKGVHLPREGKHEENGNAQRNEANQRGVWPKGGSGEPSRLKLWLSGRAVITHAWSCLLQSRGTLMVNYINWKGFIRCEVTSTQFRSKRKKFWPSGQACLDSPQPLCNIGIVARLHFLKQDENMHKSGVYLGPLPQKAPETDRNTRP